VFCESPPLFLGITARLLARRMKAGMIFNVSDLWPESAERLGLVTNQLMLGMARKLEEHLYRHSVLITGQTKGIVADIRRRFPDKKVYWLPNGADIQGGFKPELSGATWRTENGFTADDFIFMYAGIIGHAQGLEVILKAAARIKDRKNIKFVIVGSGPEKEKLQHLKVTLDLDQVYFVDAVTKKDMPSVIAGTDVALIPLRKLDLFKGAIPSKLFENLIMKKPLLLGVEGEARDLFIHEAKAGLAFVPEDDQDLAAKALEMAHNRTMVNTMGENGYHYVYTHFNRDLLTDQFLLYLNETVNKK
jgi:glycosyltransferase involved in cell wall biosynthesis